MNQKQELRGRIEKRLVRRREIINPHQPFPDDTKIMEDALRLLTPWWRRSKI